MAERTMQAVTRGGNEARHVTVTDVDVPTPSDGEVLVRIESSAINPYDLFVVLGHNQPKDLEYIPGRDLAGIVEAGPAALLNTPVWATGGEFGNRRNGFHTEYAVLPAAGVRPRPTNLSVDEAASVGVAYTTAWYALIETGHLAVGDRVLVTGGAGAVGSAAIQIARWKGASEVTSLVRDDAEGSRTLALGAGTYITEPAELSANGTRAADVNLCLDVLGGPVLGAVIPAMSDKGRIVNIATGGDGTVTFDLRKFYRANLALYGLNTGRYDVTDGARVLDALSEGFSTGELKAPSVAASFSLGAAREAYAMAASRPDGKVVLRPETPRRSPS
jgi:NADPH2:quinone reductase